MRGRDLRADTLRELLDYDAATGIFRWRCGRRGTVRKGNVAGKVASRDGYVLIKIKGIDYRAHRLVWLHVHGNWPNLHIDHINGDVADNRLSNLREATDSQNLANSRRHRDNSSGFKGVTKLPHGKWMARIRHHRKLFHLGTFDTPEMAHNAYVEAANKLFGEFARAA